MQKEPSDANYGDIPENVMDYGYAASTCSDASYSDASYGYDASFAYSDVSDIYAQISDSEKDAKSKTPKQRCAS
jgi:inosine/xanthosine triphosphate pyrophosphatase family protein